MATDNNNAENVENQAAEPDFQWYTLKVQVNRETNIQKELQRRIAADPEVSKNVRDVLVPTEKYEEYKNNRKRTLTRKKFPGYIMVNMNLDERTWFLMRGTPGVGDFTGSFGRRAADGSYTKPLPMTEEDVRLMLQTSDSKTDDSRRTVSFSVGDFVRVTGENFKDSEGKVSSIDEAAEKVTVEIILFNKPTPVTFDFWQVVKVEV